MNNPSQLQIINIDKPRYSGMDFQKSSGSTYTPINFAEFVATQMMEVATLPLTGSILILDPACGDGLLLEALINLLPHEAKTRAEIHGYDTDPIAVKAASKNLHKVFPELNIHIENRDFLEYVLKTAEQGQLDSKFHLIIANPPYVRTQTMGAKQSQAIAKNFKLNGKVDLYFPFLLGISNILEENGTTGVITSNRYMSTKSGRPVREALLSNFDIIKIWDLGDTKLFDAAVLPAVLLANGKNHKQMTTDRAPLYSSIYETKDPAQSKADTIFLALSTENDTVIAIPDGRHFRVRKGVLDNGGDPTGVWRIATTATDSWLETVKSNTWDTFKRIGKIRVGVKSTADKVFIRSDWDTIPDGRPELLRPLITRKNAAQFKGIIPSNPKHKKELLYPHEVVNGKRTPVNLELHPKSLRYLLRHRDALEARTYVIEAGRFWYELWVPHDPSAWIAPKLVFIDISEKPTFWIDKHGGVVNGECYWLKCDRENEEELLWLALAVANSSFIEEFYDHRFSNKLYSGKRRFITQYVEQFPLPNPERKESIDIVKLAKHIYETADSRIDKTLIHELDSLVWKVFGLAPKKITG